MQTPTNLQAQGDVLSNPRLLPPGGVLPISISLPLESQCPGPSAYLIARRGQLTKISKISTFFPSKPASPPISLLLFKVLPFVQGPHANMQSHVCLLLLSPYVPDMLCPVPSSPSHPHSHLLSSNPCHPFSSMGSWHPPWSPPSPPV